MHPATSTRPGARVRALDRAGRPRQRDRRSPGRRASGPAGPAAVDRARRRQQLRALLGPGGAPTQRPAGHGAARQPGRPQPARRRGRAADPGRGRGSRDRCEALARLDEITRRLRRECPWDREQDERSIVPHTVEEAYELADAAAAGDDAKLLDELGDVLFQVHFLALLLEERGAGSLAEVAEEMPRS